MSSAQFSVPVRGSGSSFSKRALQLVTSLGALLLPALASAADYSDQLGRYDPTESAESPQDLAIEIRFGRYRPDADDGVNGTPYRDVFGTENRYYGGLELDLQLLRIPLLGTLSPGFGIGYTKSSARARLQNGTTSGQYTALAIFPMYVVGVLRADVLAKRTPIPLVPYGKLGLGFAFWRATDAGETSRVGGVSGRGYSYGLQYALGGMLLLDAFDRMEARTADASIGLNHSYLFGEWSVSNLDGFGAKDQLQVGTNTWTLGLAFEF